MGTLNPTHALIHSLSIQVAKHRGFSCNLQIFLYGAESTVTLEKLSLLNKNSRICNYMTDTLLPSVLLTLLVG